MQNIMTEANNNNSNNWPLLKFQNSSLPPATKLRQGNVYTLVCDSVHREGLCPGRGVSVRETSRHHTVTCGWYASYWNAFFFFLILRRQLQKLWTVYKISENSVHKNSYYLIRTNKCQNQISFARILSVFVRIY